MSVFTLMRRNRQANKENAKKEAEPKKSTEPTKYRHVPTHAASDAMLGAPSGWMREDRPKIRDINRRRSAIASAQSSRPVSARSSRSHLSPLHVNMMAAPLHPGPSGSGSGYASGSGSASASTSSFAVPRPSSGLSKVSYPSGAANPVVHMSHSYSSMDAQLRRPVMMAPAVPPVPAGYAGASSAATAATTSSAATAATTSSAATAATTSSAATSGSALTAAATSTTVSPEYDSAAPTAARAASSSSHAMPTHSSSSNSLALGGDVLEMKPLQRQHAGAVPSSLPSSSSSYTPSPASSSASMSSASARPAGHYSHNDHYSNRLGTNSHNDHYGNRLGTNSSSSNLPSQPRLDFDSPSPIAVMEKARIAEAVAEVPENTAAMPRVFSLGKGKALWASRATTVTAI